MSVNTPLMNGVVVCLGRNPVVDLVSQAVIALNHDLEFYIFYLF